MFLNIKNNFKCTYSTYSNKADSYVTNLRFVICKMVYNKFKLSNLSEKYGIKSTSLVNNSTFYVLN